MIKDTFIGRKEELAELNALLKKKSASLITLKGRRRVGKSRLVEHFAKNKRYYKFVGLAPVEGITAQDQRNEFSRRLNEQFGIPEIQTDDWAKLFTLLAREVKLGRVIILFDEISWMASGDKTFLSKLKNSWDDEFKKNNNLMLILCSSISIWIEENIISSTAYFGRISWTLHLDPLPLSDCNKMLKVQGFKSSTYEKFKLLSVTGGIPWYIEQMQSQYSAEENIKRQCFTRGGMLVTDFDKIFHDLFGKQEMTYKDVIFTLENGSIDYNTISKRLNYPKSGRLSKYLTNLQHAGFITQDFTWSLKTGKLIKLSVYRLSDNYVRFYLKYIAPKREHIESKRIKTISLSSLSGWDSIMGLQFENLVVNNRHEIYKALNISSETIIYDGPFFQRKTTNQKGCQIDFLIHTKFKTIYVVEVKFSRNTINRKIIEEVENKIKCMSIPRGIGVLPVLVHVNTVSEQVTSSDFFHSIINFSELLESA